jgi:hypothetical protein
MTRPIETLLSLPRLRLADRVPIIETENLVRQLADREQYHPRLVQRAYDVSTGSVKQFSEDHRGLSTLLEEVNAAEYIVTKRSKNVLEQMLNGICGDGFIYKEFEHVIEPLCQVSQSLRHVSNIADSLADKTKEESLDLARALLIDLPKHDNEPNAA